MRLTSKQIRLFLLLALLLACKAEDVSSDYTFEQYEQQFNRNYTGQEREAHRKAFNKNYQELLNTHKSSGGDFKVKVNNFTDMTDQEKSSLLSYRPTSLEMPYDKIPKSNKLRAMALPTQLNYTALGKVTSVKNQGKCGACWAFTTAAMYESQLLINREGEYDLSEQYILECTQGSSCNGGWPNSALNTFTQNGLPTQSSYAYKGNGSAYGQDQICETKDLIKLTNPVNSIKHYNQMSESQLKQTLLDYGPVSVGMNAGDTGFLYYAGGIFTGCPQTTNQNQIDHVVLLTGWTKDGNWIVKNSWGKGWGDKGYGVIDRTRNCGINLFVDVLEIKEATPTTVANASSPSEVTIKELQTVKVDMTDSFGDGYNGYVFGIRQGKSIVTVFGDQFVSGSHQGPIDIQLKSGVDTQVVVTVAGKNPQQIGFVITDNTGKQLCKRTSGAKFDNSIIFCEFCIGCNVSNTVSYDLTLFDANNNGWNGNVLAFKQDGVQTSFGEQFSSGQKYGPRKYQFIKNVPVEVVAYKIGISPNDIGFEIRDDFGNIVAQRKAGTAFSPDAKLASFCPGCSNFYSVNSVQLSDPTRENYSISQRPLYSKPLLIAVIVLSAVLFLLIIGIVVAYVLNVRKNNADNFPKKDFQGVSILGSTATIPDQSPDPNKIIPTSTQQYKIN